MIRINSQQDCKEIAQKYWNKQVLQFNGNQEDATVIAKLIYSNLIFLGVPQEDLKNYTTLVDVFINWLIGNRISATDNEKYTFEEINPNKGFYLIGDCGTGKTTFLDAISLALNEYYNTNKPAIAFYSHYSKKNTDSIRFIPLKVRANSITRAFRIGGDCGKFVDGKIFGGIDRYSAIGCSEEDTRHIQYNGDIETPDEKRYPVLYIDDFRWGGTAANTSSFGNSVDVLTEIIKNRYDRNLLTFITSNSAPTDIDEATKDRMKSMFNVIVFKGSSNRK